MLSHHEVSALRASLATFLFFGAFRDATATTFTTTTTVGGSTKSDLEWAVASPSVEIRIAVNSVTFLEASASFTVTYTSSSSGSQIDCRFLRTTSSCTEIGSLCTISSGYNTGCQQNSGGDQLVITVTISTLTSVNDNNAVLSLPSSGASAISDWSFTPLTMTVLECDTTAFEGATTSTSGECGYNCTKTFSCNSFQGFQGSDFTRSCSTDAEWNDNTSGCTKSTAECNGTVFQPAVLSNSTITPVAGQTVRFNCMTGCQPVTFDRTCLADGNWSDLTIPCVTPCPASAFAECSSEVDNTIACGEGTIKDFACSGDWRCGEATFTATCGAGAEWKTAECPCTKCGFGADNIVTIAGSCIWLALAVVWSILLCKRHGSNIPDHESEKKIEISKKKTVVAGGGSLLFLVISIVLLTVVFADCFNLCGGDYAGFVFMGLCLISMGVFIVGSLQGWFDKGENSKVSPLPPMVDNSNLDAEAVELNPKPNAN